MTILLPQEPHYEAQSPRSKLRVWYLQGSVVRTVATGTLETMLVAPWLRNLDAWLAREPNEARVRLFHDWGELQDYDMVSRLDLTRWGAVNRQRIESVHILTQSKVIIYGIAAANIVLRGLVQTHEERTTFDRVFRAAQLGTSG